MIPLALAKQLKDAGLTWRPELLDYFGLPDRSMDERIFVISDMLATVELLAGSQMVAFQGASEWALDSIITQDVVWIPREDQLRLAFEAALLESGRPEFMITGGLGGYQIELIFGEQKLAFNAANLEDAYARALLHLLRSMHAG